MKKAKRFLKKIKHSVSSITAMPTRYIQNSKFDSLIKGYKSNTQIPKDLSIAVVFLPGSDISPETVNSIEKKLSGKYSHKIITFNKQGSSLLEVNDAILEAKTDFVILLNNINDISRDFDFMLLDTYYSNKDTGAVGGRTYYSSGSGKKHSYLIKQNGVTTQKSLRKDNVTSDYILVEKDHMKSDWENDIASSEMTIPSTDCLLISAGTFAGMGGLSHFYDAGYLTYAMADLCLLLKNYSHTNYLCRGCICSFKHVGEDNKTKKARLFDRDVFKGRWYSHLAEASLPDLELDDSSIDILGAMPGADTAKFWGDQHYAMALKKAFEKLGFKSNVLSKEHWYDPSSSKFVLVLRGNRPYFKTALPTGKIILFWTISHPAEITPLELDQADHVFFASSIMQEKFAPSIHTKHSVLPQCTDPDIMDCPGPCAHSPELLFVGNSRHVYRKILADLLPTTHELKVFGRHWEEFPLVQEKVVSEYIDNNKVASAYHNATILLNDHWDDMREYGIISNRIFDALASGSFVISDDVPGIHDVLGDSVVTYTDKADLEKKVDYYLTHKDERNKLASMGRMLVVEKHSFDARVLDIIRTIVRIKL